MPNGRIEARYTLATAWTGTCTNSVATTSVFTVAAGTYYASQLVAAVQAALLASVSPFATWTVTVANGGSGTGLVTVSKGAAGTWSITWTSTDLRDALGFTANIVAVTSAQTSTAPLKGLWLPDCPFPFSTATIGHYVTDKRSSVSPTGVVLTIAGNRRRELPRATWSHISKARACGVSTLMTWELFWLETQFGDKTYFGPGARLALYSDASISLLLGYYHLVDDRGTSEMPRPVANYDNFWSVTLARLVNQDT